MSVTTFVLKDLAKAKLDNDELRAKLAWFERREKGAIEPLRLSILNDPRCSQEQQDAVRTLDAWDLDDPFPGEEP